MSAVHADQELGQARVDVELGADSGGIGVEAADGSLQRLRQSVVGELERDATRCEADEAAREQRLVIRPKGDTLGRAGEREDGAVAVVERGDLFLVAGERRGGGDVLRYR
jgi:hypothetical protein